MSPFLYLLAPLSFLLTPQADRAAHEGEAALTAEQASAAPTAAEGPSWLEMITPLQWPVAQQVRIERRVVLRISPVMGTTRQNLAAAFPAPRGTTRLAERAFGDCIPVSSIAAVQAQRGNRLLLYLRDRRLLAADLEKACLAQNFYSGFYIEESDDGRLCVDREKLQSRSGAKCSVSSLRQIVAISED